MSATRRGIAWIDRLWYGGGRARWLLPLSLVFLGAIKLRRLCYTSGLLKVQRLPVPVVVVGNLSVGGTGKTPLVLWVVKWLRDHGYRPGVVTRGYGGKAGHWPQAVTADSDPVAVGDEALLIARHGECPVMAGPRRGEAARALPQRGNCDIIVSDDGLQHYALGRDVEIAVIDGERRLGNGCVLPAGPLREPASRLREVDLVVCNGRAREGEFTMDVVGGSACHIGRGEVRALKAFSREVVHAVAGLGNPERFFRLLTSNGLSFERHIFPDHYVYNERDLDFGDARAVLMTEKDAVKCTHFRDDRLWYVPVQAKLDETFGARLLTLLQERRNGQ